MMKIALLSSVFLPASLVTAAGRPADLAPTSCSKYSIQAENADLYHGDKVCDRSNFNQFKSNLGRGRKYQQFKQTHEMNMVPNQKTVICPLEVEDLSGNGQAQTTGFDTVWIVENTSSEPVVLSFVKADGVEYSAVTPSITPPQNDPQAFVYPKKWRAIYAWDGHIFHARSFDKESGNLGPVVMQHRTGLIPIGANAKDLVCPTDDPEPVVEETRAPDFQRTPPAIDRPCNTIDIGFRNLANCPLHGYFIESNSTAGTCRETFRFHLGLNRAPADFMWGWDSPTKFEGSFVGHSFAFRSASDTSILVDTVTLQPSRIIDCPELKEKAQINRVTTVGELQEVFLPLSNDGEAPKQFDDSLLHMDRRQMASIFNETVMNTTTSKIMNGTTSTSTYGSSSRTSMVVVNSF